MNFLKLGAIALTTIIALTACRPAGVRVKIVNESGKTVETVEFWHEQADQLEPTLLEKIGPIESGKENKILLREITGEGAYSTQATFEDGEQLKGGAGYVEGGYRVVETIEKTEIISEINFY